MSKRILIDAVHPEEVRVVVTEDSGLHDFEFETSTKKQIKGNIYLAKVTRVEPSLQAAFVEYGGNKQGFLPFSEIHPDYYQIPVSDKEDNASEVKAENLAEDEEARVANDNASVGEEAEQSGSDIDEVGEESDVAAKRPNLYRRYKIQEVVKRGQVLLVQVMKEERGNKGASLTTYLSLPGRYSVFMPNSERQGGVSRRIGDIETRRRLKAIIDELEVSEGTSVIIRTAGSFASREEIRRDYDYLSRTWEDIKKMTVSSSAPTMIYEEGNIIKRTMRDLFDNTIDEIVIQGEEAYEQAKEVLKMLSGAQSAKLKLHNESIPIFWHYQVEDELAKLFDNKAYLKSGGYIVINSTEALVAIDVNSGKSTRERNVEETATKTNLEAAYEIARQLRLRDLAGLIVIDFIDMMDSRNRRSVERALKDALSADRAKIQVGRISPFGLLEMSRQRLHSSLVESNMVACTTCQGTGIIRSPESTAMGIIRAINSEADKGNVSKIIVNSPMEVAFYLLNKKRQDIALIEERCDVKVVIEGNETLKGQDYFIKSEQDPSREASESRRNRKKKFISEPSSEDNYENPRDAAPEEEFNGNIYKIDSGRDDNREERGRGGRHRRRGRFEGRRRKHFSKGYEGRDDRGGDDRKGRGGGRWHNRHHDHDRKHGHGRGESNFNETSSQSITNPAIADKAVKRQTESKLKNLWRKITE